MTGTDPKTYALSEVAGESVAARIFPGVTLTGEVGEFGTLLAIDRAAPRWASSRSTPGAST